MSSAIAYRKLIRQLDEKISDIQRTGDLSHNSRDSLNLIRLRMLKKNTQARYRESLGIRVARR